MDFSDMYAKMCDCDEVRKNIKEDSYSRQNNIFFGPVTTATEESKEIWLPQQDQIQEMFNYNSVDMTFNYDTGAGQHLYSLLIDLDNDKPMSEKQRTKLFEMDSFEQCWLAFYMYEKHGKAWDGEKWVEK